MAERNKVSTKQIGDGKLPNRYWVSISNDFYYQREDVWEWASERDNFEVNCSTLAKFNTYKEARDFMDNHIELGQECDGIMANCVFIEDRLTGTIWEEAMYETQHLIPGHRDDTQFTIDEMKEHGLEFK